MAFDFLQALTLDENGRTDNRPYLMQNLSPVSDSSLVQ